MFSIKTSQPSKTTKKSSNSLKPSIPLTKPSLSPQVDGPVATSRTTITSKKHYIWWMSVSTLHCLAPILLPSISISKALSSSLEPPLSSRSPNLKWSDTRWLKLQFIHLPSTCQNKPNKVHAESLPYSQKLLTLNPTDKPCQPLISPNGQSHSKLVNWLKDGLTALTCPTMALLQFLK